MICFVIIQLQYNIGFSLAHSELCQTSNTVGFEKVVYRLKLPVIFGKGLILDIF